MDKFTVRDSSGVVDVVASAAAYADALTAWVAENEADAQRLTGAINAVIDRFPGQTLHMPFLVAAAVTELGATPADHKVLTLRVHKQVQTLASENGPLTIGKGKNGGVSRK